MSLLSVDSIEFGENFEKRAFYIEHHLQEHPLFQLSRLIGLSRKLPRKSVEYNAGNVPITLDPGATPGNGLSVEETIRSIEEHSSWLVLKNVEQDPEYRELLDHCLDEIRGAGGASLDSMSAREGFIFISSAGAVTPYHMDPEHNFLLQIRGDKVVTQFDRDNPLVAGSEVIENFYLSGSRNLAYRDEFAVTAREYPLAPGQGLHFPVTVPHWVRVGRQYSISFSITFRTDALNRRERIYRLNGKLRKMGIRPTPYGRSWFIDSLKHSSVLLKKAVF